MYYKIKKKKKKKLRAPKIVINFGILWILNKLKERTLFITLELLLF